MYKFIIILSLSLISIGSFAQSKFTISGTIKDAKNGETLIGAGVTIKEKNVSVVSNVFGFYSITEPEGSYTIVINYIGYKPYSNQIKLDKNFVLNIELEESSKELNTVEIKAESAADNVRKIEMSVAKLDIKQINKIPALLGEVDIVRAIQLLPGVSTVGEGATGFNVRGGSIDQNLILLDDAPVYNSAHLFGFFSVFNPDAVKDVKLLKAGIPSQYGGRLSSILDVRNKDGNNKNYQVNGGVGVIFSRLSIEGPIIKNKSSFILAGRRSYFDQFFFLSKNANIKDATAYFYDFTGKANYIINDKNRIYISGYSGRDKFGFGGDNGFGWDNGNLTSTVRYNHIFNRKLFSNVSAIFSNYDYAIGIGDNFDGFSWKANIINYSVKPEFTYYLNDNNTLTFGGQSTYYTFNPGKLIFYSKGEKREVGDKNKYALENGLYAGNEQKVNSVFSLQYGLRFSNFNFVGPGTAYFFKDTVSIYARENTGSKEYGKNEVIKSYNNLEPRFSIKAEINEYSSIKASYNRTVQYIHLISNTTASTPFDVWTPSTNNILPQLADQVALGYFKNFGKDEMFESSVEVYYKDMQNQLDYADGADLFLNKLLDGEVINGIGRAYGAEFYLKKSSGKFTGWVSYTLARSERKTGQINNGNWYPARFDRTHNLNVIASYDINKRLSLSSNFVISTGTPATFPTNRLEVQEYVIPHNVDNFRNNTRIPTYHRLDISATYQLKKHFNDKFESNIVISVYNVYGRKNPFSIYFQGNPDVPNNTEAVRFAVIGIPIPAVTYNFKF
jgi:hypothetical protein